MNNVHGNFYSTKQLDRIFNANLTMTYDVMFGINDCISRLGL